MLIIPLRLGLNEFNQDYKESIKVKWILDYLFKVLKLNLFNGRLFFQKSCFQLKQSVGMIGGKPNQAYFFYGYSGKI